MFNTQNSHKGHDGAAEEVRRFSPGAQGGSWTAALHVSNLLFAAAALLVIGAAPAGAEHLQANTIDAFDRYVHAAENAADREVPQNSGFLWIGALAESGRTQAYAKLKQGQIITRQCPQCVASQSFEIAGGLVHDWTGLVFVPGVTMRETLALLQDYDHDTEYYGPQVVKSQLLSRSGDDFHVLLRLKQVQAITVVFDAEYDIHYAALDIAHADSRSYSTRISEVENPDELGERDLPAGDDRGFLWRLDSYWRFLEADGGTYIQCRAISLTRDIPSGLAWAVRPFIQNIPGDSLRFTLDATRKALLRKFNSGSSPDAKEKTP